MCGGAYVEYLRFYNRWSSANPMQVLHNSAPLRKTGGANTELWELCTILEDDKTGPEEKSSLE